MTQTKQTGLFPDTLYLPEKAELAINCLTGGLDPQQDQLPYCLIDLTGQPPRMIHTRFDWSDHTARVIDAIILAEELSGSSAGSEVLSRLFDLLQTGFGSDGLHYTPDNPWTPRHANMHYQRSVINALLSWHLATGEEKPRKLLVQLLNGLKEISIKKEGYWYFPAVEHLADGWPRGDWDILGFGVDPANTNGRLLFGLCRAYELTGESVAAELAHNYAAHVMHHSGAFLPDGSFSSGIEFREGHFHSRAVTILGVVRFGYTFSDGDAITWGIRAYEKAKSYGSTFGWYPERVVESGAHGCETCAVVDMMEIAIWLARAGQTQYWEDAERILRNQLVESQLSGTCSLGSHQHDGPAVSAANHGTTEWETTDRVVERSVGGFAGWSQPNDLLSKVMHNWDLYMCCCAQGVRGLFNAWNNVVTINCTSATVNLLINYASPEITVKSWLPNQGKVEITSAQSRALHVRVPNWVDPATITATCDGDSLPARLERGYLDVEQSPTDRTVTVAFGVAERTTRENILNQNYELTWRGNTVVDISPSGNVIPLYQRAAMRGEEIEMARKTLPEVRFQL